MQATIKHAATLGQKEFIESTARTCAFVGGVGSGKTRASVLKALGQPAGTVGMLISPSYRMLKDTLLRTYVEVARGVTVAFNQTELHARLIDGKEILFRSADNPEALRGPNLAWAGLDEAALMTKGALDITLGRLRLEPGRMWFTTTPKGKNHWLYSFTTGDNAHVIRARSMDNPYLPREYLEELKKQYTADFYRQEVLGEFIEPGGTVFKGATYYDELPQAPYKEATGCDFGYTEGGGDFTVFIRGRMIGETLYVTHFYRKQAEINEWAEHLKLELNPFAFIGGQEKGIIQVLQRQFKVRVKAQSATQDKLLRAQGVAAAWNDGRVLLPRNAPWLMTLLDEVLSFTGDSKVDPHDDAIDALAALHHALAKSNPLTPETRRKLAPW